MNRDNYDKEMLRAVKSIAASLKTIEKEVKKSKGIDIITNAMNEIKRWSFPDDHSNEVVLVDDIDEFLERISRGEDTLPSDIK